MVPGAGSVGRIASDDRRKMIEHVDRRELIQHVE